MTLTLPSELMKMFDAASLAMPMPSSAAAVKATPTKHNWQQLSRPQRRQQQDTLGSRAPHCSKTASEALSLAGLYALAAAAAFSTYYKGRRVALPLPLLSFS